MGRRRGEEAGCNPCSSLPASMCTQCMLPPLQPAFLGAGGSHNACPGASFPRASPQVPHSTPASAAAAVESAGLPPRIFPAAVAAAAEAVDIAKSKVGLRVQLQLVQGLRLQAAVRWRLTWGSE